MNVKSIELHRTEDDTEREYLNTDRPKQMSWAKHSARGTVGKVLNIRIPSLTEWTQGDSQAQEL